jgi:hypothetical protein
MAASALPICFSLVFEERVAMAMVEEYRRVGLTLTVVRSQLKKNNKLVLILPMAQSLACLRRGSPILDAPGHPREGGGVGAFCWSLSVCF